MGSFEISRAGIYPKYPEETVLFPVYTTRQRNFALYVTGVIFTCKYFKFGLNTTGLSQSHFRNLSACSISRAIYFLFSCKIFCEWNGKHLTNLQSYKKAKARKIRLKCYKRQRRFVSEMILLADAPIRFSFFDLFSADNFEL